jgi:hypothetical protein
LAGDLKAVWRDPTTDVRLKKRIVRELIRGVIADLDEQDGETISWCIGWGVSIPSCVCHAADAGSATVRRQKS